MRCRIALALALALAGCRRGRVESPPPRPSTPPPPPTSSSSPTWAQAKPTRVEEIFTSKEPIKAFAFGGDILVVRRQENRFRIAQLKNGALVDEEAWSRGLSAPQKCSRIEAVFGRFPDRLWLVENAGGSHECESTFGTFVMWRRKNGSWAKDAAHSPSPQPAAAGIFATWPLGPAALGFGISNLVGDTLSLPEEVMWPAATDPWKTRVRVRHEGVELVAMCGSATGTVTTLSFAAGRPVVRTMTADGKTATIEVPSAHAPDGPCAIGEKDIVFVQRRVAPAERETWSAVDRATGAWRSVTVPWPDRTERVDFSGARILAWTADPKGRKHVFFANREASSWTELADLPDADIEVVSMTVDDELLLLVEDTKLVRVGLPRP